VTSVALPPVMRTVLRKVELSLNVTVPVGVPNSPGRGKTAAVKRTGAPAQASRRWFACTDPFDEDHPGFQPFFCWPDGASYLFDTLTAAAVGLRLK
jgi:hypothetical protein